MDTYTIWSCVSIENAPNAPLGMRFDNKQAAEKSLTDYLTNLMGTGHGYLADFYSKVFHIQNVSTLVKGKLAYLQYIKRNGEIK